MKGAKAAVKGAKAARIVRARPLKKFKIWFLFLSDVQLFEGTCSFFAQTDGDARWRMIADGTAGNQ